MNAVSRLNSVRVSSTGWPSTVSGVLIEIEPQPAGDQHVRRGARQLVEPGAAQQRVDPRHHLAGVERLGDVVVGAQLQAHDLVGVFHARGQHDDRRGGQRLVGAHDARDLPTVEVRHHQVEDDQVGPLAAQHVQRGLAIGGGEHLVAGLLQVAAQHFDDGLIIVNDQDSLWHRSHSSDLSVPQDSQENVKRISRSESAQGAWSAQITAGCECSTRALPQGRIANRGGQRTIPRIYAGDLENSLRLPCRIIGADEGRIAIYNNKESVSDAQVSLKQMTSAPTTAPLRAPPASPTGALTLLAGGIIAGCAATGPHAAATAAPEAGRRPTRRRAAAPAATAAHQGVPPGRLPAEPAARRR